MKEVYLPLVITSVTLYKSGSAIAVLVFLSIVLTRFSKRCNSCGKWNSLYEANRVFDEYKWRKKIYKTTHKDSKGRITGTTEREGRERYRIDLVTIECNSCGNTYTRRYEEGKRIGDSGVSLFVFGIIIIGSYCLGSYLGTAKAVEKRPSNSVTQESNPQLNRPQHPNSVPKKDSDALVNTELPENNNNENIPKSDNSNIQRDTSKLSNENEKLITNQTIEKIINEETPEAERMEVAKTMLERGKSLREVSDSTFLTIRQVRRIRRSLKNSDTDD